MDIKKLLRLGGTGQSKLIKGKEVSFLDLVNCAIDRIGSLDIQLKSVVHQRFDRARAQSAWDSRIEKHLFVKQRYLLRPLQQKLTILHSREENHPRIGI